MIQYNLRLDKSLKDKGQALAKARGLSENSLYQTAIEEFIAKNEATEFYQKLMARTVPEKDKQQILKKLKANKTPPLYPQDKR